MDWIARVRTLFGGAVTSAASAVGAAGDDELGREDLLKQTAEGILALRRHGAKGKDVFPPGVVVHVTARDGSLESLRRFTADADFEADLDARLRNALSNPGVLPARRYRIEVGGANTVRVEDDTTGVQAVFVVEGGDKDGDRFLVQLSAREWRVGRGRWHQEGGDDRRLANDVMVTETAAFVSRAAAVIERTGAFMEVVSRQQRDFLVVIKADGTQVRPHLTAAGRAALGIGDRLEFNDGVSAVIALRVDALESA